MEFKQSFLHWQIFKISRKKLSLCCFSLLQTIKSCMYEYALPEKLRKKFNHEYFLFCKKKSQQYVYEFIVVFFLMSCFKVVFFEQLFESCLSLINCLIVCLFWSTCFKICLFLIRYRAVIHTEWGYQAIILISTYSWWLKPCVRGWNKEKKL
jgi:hypothetical protein